MSIDPNKIIPPTQKSVGRAPDELPESDQVKCGRCVNVVDIAPVINGVTRPDAPRWVRWHCAKHIDGDGLPIACWWARYEGFIPGNCGGDAKYYEPRLKVAR